MTKKRATRPATARSRDALGRFRSKASIARVRGWETRRRDARAKVRAARKVVTASRHGEQARKRTEAKLSPAALERRRKDARRVTQKARRAKKDPRATKRRGPSSRWTSSPRSARNTSTSTTSSSKRPPSIEIQSDRFAAQISGRFSLPAGFTPTDALLREAIAYRVKHGEDPEGVTLKILRWRNPGRRRSEDRAWRQGNQDDAWLTLGKVIEASL